MAKLSPLLLSGLELANTVNASRSLVRNGSPSLPLFLAGWPTSELPLHALSLSAVRLARSRDSLHGLTGTATLALTGASWLGLGRAYLQGRRSAAVLDTAVSAAVGRSVAVPASDLRTIRTPLRRRRRYVSAYGTHAYGDAGRRNLLDVWRHPGLPDDAKAPVILQIPGGGWITGGRRGQAYPLLTHLARAGWVGVSMSYRVSPRHRWPAHLVDVKRALAWVKENIANYGGDPDFVVVTGGSAGGHLAALAALTAHDRSLQPGFEDVDLSVAAAVPLYGRYDWVGREGPGRHELARFLERVVIGHTIADDPDVFHAASPLHRVHAGAPPFFVVHGAEDSLIPVEEARAFVTALSGVSRAAVAYAELPGAQHAFDLFNSPRARNTARSVHRFVSMIHGGDAR